MSATVEPLAATSAIAPARRRSWQSWRSCQPWRSWRQWQSWRQWRWQWLIGRVLYGTAVDRHAKARGISIPTAGVESLNAAMAATILLYEARRQRSVQS